MADTRKDKRAPVSLKVRFKSATVDEFIEQYSKDVSRGGIFIKSSQPMVVGTLLKFQFQLKDESALIRGVGRVVWTRAEEDAAADQPAGMGIKFIKMDNESRALVERILDSHASDPGGYERGRSTASTAELSSSLPPPPARDPFFPDLPAAELPLPEDRTAVRQATQFLAAALSEGGTDQAAAREAQERAEQARLRSEEVEAQRREQAEERKRKEREKEQANQLDLPSMIVDPGLEPRPAVEDEPYGEPRSGAGGREVAGGLGVDPLQASDTEPPVPLELVRTLQTTEPMAPVTAELAEQESAPSGTTTTSFPPTPEASGRKSYLPVAVIVVLLMIAAAVALRGGPREIAVEQPSAKAPAVAPEAPSIRPAPDPEPALVEPGVAPSAEPEPSAEPAPAEQDPAAAAESDAAVAAIVPGESEEAPAPDQAEAPSEPAVTAEVAVASNPKGAQIYVGDELQGSAPLKLALAVGSPVELSARAPGYAEARQSLTPRKRNDPVRFKLKALRYIVHVETAPAGAAVNVAGAKGVAPTDLTLHRPPTEELAVSARLDGYERARTRLAPTAFAEADGAMRAMLNLTLTPESAAAEPGASEQVEPAAPAERRVAPQPSAPEPTDAQAPAGSSRRARRRARASDAPAAAEPPTGQVPAAGAAPAEAAPVDNAPPPAPAEPLPDNPFGAE